MLSKHTESARKQAHIFGVGVDSTPREGLLVKIAKKLAQNPIVPVFIVTPNPEIILQAQNDTELKKILNGATISLPDGSGVVWAAGFLGYKGPVKQIRGREFFLDLVELAEKRNWKVALMGSASTIRAAEWLSATHPNLNILGLVGPMLSENGDPVTQKDRKVEKEVVGRLKQYKPTMLFVGFGAPKQEKWINKWQTELNVPLAMAVGGAFDVVSGKLATPPKLLEEMGMEWLWRLFQEPKRIRRIMKAIVTFPLKVIWFKLTS